MSEWSTGCSHSPRYGERMARPLARCSPLCRHERLSERRRTRHVAVARLGHRGLQPQPAVRPIHDRATGRRPAAECDARSADRDRLQPQSSRQCRRGHHSRRICGRVRRRSRRHHGHRLARTDDGLRALPRPQVRSRHAARVLPAVRLLQQRAGTRQGRQVRQLAPLGSGSDAAAAARTGGIRSFVRRCRSGVRAPRPRLARRSNGLGEVGRSRDAARLDHRRRARCTLLVGRPAS